MSKVGNCCTCKFSEQMVGQGRADMLFFPLWIEKIGVESGKFNNGMDDVDVKED